MDPSRFGRVLGTGTRLAARTLASAAAAAAAENPSARRAAPAAAPKSASAPPSRGVPGPNPPRTSASPQSSAPASSSSVAQKIAQPAARAKATVRGVRQGSKKFGEAVWGPLARLSGVLWLEVMGTFFGLFAFLASAGAWKQRAVLHARAADPLAYERFLLVLAVALLFTYFCITSFIRANRRERHR